MVGAIALLSSTTCIAEEFEDFDSIVKGLSGQSRAKVTTEGTEQSPLDTSEIHVGAGLANEFSTMVIPNGRRMPINQKGIQAALGIDLFSKYWLAEGTTRSFADQTNDRARVQLQEFDLKVYNKGQLTNVFGYRAGLGLSGRYLTITEGPDAGEGSSGRTFKYVTPSSVFVAGLEARFNSFLSVGSDVSYRSALIADTIDQNSFDFVVRVDAHF